MDQIKFSHNYLKMPDNAFSTKALDQRTMILEVFRVKSQEELSKEFKEYDTEYFEFNAIEHFKLPRGELLVILLITYGQFDHRVWTTIRSWNPEKEVYYRSLRGRYINITRMEES